MTQAIEEMTTIKVDEAAKLLEIPENTLRKGLQQGLFPFGVAIKVESQYSYFIFKKRLEMYIRGELWETKENGMLRY